MWLYLYFVNYHVEVSLSEIHFKFGVTQSCIKLI